MKVLQVTFTREEFDRIPEVERTHLVMLGHVANEMNVLVRIFHWSALAVDSTPIEAKANNGIVFAVIRLFTAKLYEAWKLLSNGLSDPHVRKLYEEQLDQDEKGALKRLKKYFGKRNVVQIVRNKHSFHYTPGEVKEAYAFVPQEEELSIFVGDSDLNNFYYYADLIANVALLHAISPGDHSVAMEKLQTETTKVHSDLHAVIMNLMYVAVSSHLGKSFEELRTTEVEIDPALDAEHIKIPFFVKNAGAAVQQGVPADPPEAASRLLQGR